MTDADRSAAHAPAVSVVMATYNRSNILRYAIESVRWQTITDWELLVIGDACTDDTAAVVAAIGDPRVTFHNLPHNNGEQSAPNNEGLRRARGRCLAFLNHDDLWLPDHLETALQALDARGADLVWPLALRWSGTFDAFGWRLGKKGKYTPDLVVPASLWVFRRELVARVGFWRHYTECHGAPSQDWLFRAYTARARLHHVPRVTVVKARNAAGSYVDRVEDLHRALFDRVQGNPRFREDAITEVMTRYVQAAAAGASDGDSGVGKIARRLVAHARGRQMDIPHKEFSPWINALLIRLGLNPVSVGYFVRYGQKGRKLEHLRIKRGLAGSPGGAGGVVAAGGEPAPAIGNVGVGGGEPFLH
jgi:glycosyltransferase involved in cell wall biosynthesis